MRTLRHSAKSSSVISLSIIIFCSGSKSCISKIVVELRVYGNTLNVLSTRDRALVSRAPILMPNKRTSVRDVKRGVIPWQKDVGIIARNYKSSFAAPEMRSKPVRKNRVLQIFDAVVAHSAAGHLRYGRRIFEHGPSSRQCVDENLSAVRGQHVRDHLQKLVQLRICLLHQS